MDQLRIVAAGQCVVLDMLAANEFVDNGESDEYALAQLDENDICDFVSYVDEDDLL